MTDRTFLFLAALAGDVAALGTVIWLIGTGQLGTFDGNFLCLAALIIAISLGLYLIFMINRAMDDQPAAKRAAIAAKKPEKVPELAGKV